VAVIRAPNVGFQRPVAPYCASDDPVSCLVKEPTTLFVEGAYK